MNIFRMNVNYENNAIYSYCSNCLSDNLKKDDNGYFLETNGFYECLDCGWKGKRYDVINMTKNEHKREMEKIRGKKLRRLIHNINTKLNF